MRCTAQWLCGSGLLLLLSNTHADDFFQVLDTGTQTADTTRNQNWDYRAYLQQTLKYGWETPEANSGHGREKSGVAQIKTHLFGEAQGKWSDHNGWQISFKGENEWYDWADNQSQWHSHNGNLRLKDAFIDVTTQGGTWLRAGHQILAWGQAEGLVITDALSPQDLREPLQAELQDIREQIPALLISTPTAHNSKFMAVLTYKANPHRFADAGEPFDFFAPYRLTGMHFTELDPKSDWETAVKWEAQFNGGDASLMAARVNDNNLSLAAIDQTQVYLAQQRQSVMGISANRAFGNWLLKTEVARWQQVPVPVQSLDPWQHHNQTRTMAGLEYAGWQDALLSIEVNNNHIHSHTQQLSQSADNTGYVARLRYSAWNDRVTQQWWWIKLATENAEIARWDLSLDWSDHWTFNLGAVVYKVRDPASLFWTVRHEDSINFSARYSF